MYKQEPPFCIQVEFTEGCNLMCQFCGIQGIREKAGGPYKFMTPELARKVALDIKKAGWSSRIEFAMHGEPTMNPNFIELVKIFRETLPNNQLMMTSNGGGLLKDTKERVAALFAAGLNILALDDYKRVAIVPKVRERLPDGIVLKDYPKDGLDWSPHRRRPKSTKMIIVIQDLADGAGGTHSTITNHCGCGSPPNNKAVGKRCAKPFRELGVRWNGDIAGCCNDFRGVFKVGNCAKTSLAELWQSKYLQAMRKKMFAGQRDFGACRGCDYLTYRNGLLPDHAGKESLPAPTKRDNELVREACSGQPFTTPCRRPWEK
jgi:radical SAM protein with 4Fe4S-binding SPASM domain